MKTILGHLAAKRAVMAELVASSLFINLLGLAGTAFVMLVLARYVPYGVDATLVTLTFGVALAAVLELGFREARRRLATGILREEKDRWTNDAFGLLVGVRAAALDRIPAAARAEVMRGVEAVERAVDASNLSALLDVPFSLVTLIVLGLLSPTLAVVALCCVILSAAVVKGGELATRGAMPGVNDAEARLKILSAEATAQGDELRAFNLAAALRLRWSSARKTVEAARERAAAAQGLAGGLSQFLVTAQSIAIIAIGAVLCVKGELSTAQLIGANILAGRALGPLNRLVTLIEPLSRAGLALKRLEEFGRLPREQVSGSALRTYEGRIELVDLAFGHPGAAMPLGEHLNLVLPAGTILAVAGPNGSGKTTFARLLMGLAEPLRGQVLADGIEFRQLSMEWWRRQVCYLPQEPTFFDGTVADNLRAANPGIDEHGLGVAVASAGLKGWLDTTALGFQTPLADGGRTLPPGIRRRLALARALATGGRLCVFDEPTEGLDPEGMAAVYVTLRRLAAEGRTLVVCSNDPGVVRGCHMLVDLGIKPQPRVVTAPAQPEAANA